MSKFVCDLSFKNILRIRFWRASTIESSHWVIQRALIFATVLKTQINLINAGSVQSPNFNLRAVLQSLDCVATCIQGLYYTQEINQGCDSPFYSVLVAHFSEHCAFYPKKCEKSDTISRWLCHIAIIQNALPAVMRGAVTEIKMVQTSHTKKLCFLSPLLSKCPE